MALRKAEAELGAAVKAGQKVLGMMSLWKDVGETPENTQAQQLGTSNAWDQER